MPVPTWTFRELLRKPTEEWTQERLGQLPASEGTGISKSDAADSAETLLENSSMENTVSPALLMCAKPCVRACAIAFLVPIAQLALFRALLKTLTKTQNNKLGIARHSS